MTLRQGIHPRVTEASAAGPLDVVRVTRELSDPDLGRLVLWLTRVEDGDLESGRVLAIECGRAPDTAIARACRAWLMRNSANDLGIVHTLLSSLGRDLVEQRAWPTFLTGQALTFLRTALSQAETSVSGEVLSLLLFALDSGLLKQILHAGGSVALADDLRSALGPVADNQERADLDRLEEYLRHPDMPNAPALDSRALQRLVLDLMDAVDRYSEMVTGVDGLVKFVRERALTEDAGIWVAAANRPLQTLRVKANETATRLVQAFVGFAEAAVRAIREPDSAEVGAPDYGIQMSCAPAASMPIHLSYVGDDARSAFGMLEQLVRGAETRAIFDQVVGTLPPDVVVAFLAVLERLRQRDDEIEVFLTDSQSAAWQRSVVLGPRTLGRDSVTTLARRARSAVQGQRVTVPRDQVPQANTVRQVFQAVDAVLARGEVTVDDIDDINSSRQVNYYKQGARILGFLDADNQPTARARAISDLDNSRRLALTAIYFEDSPIGRAWRAWAGVNRLPGLDPTTAQAFLEACVAGLSGTTPGRRASTLRTWLDELLPHYPPDPRAAR